MDFSENLVAITLTLLFGLSIYLFSKSRKESNKRLPPEAPGGWPVIGHLPLLSGSQPPHITLGNIADEIGPIFTLRFGVHPTVVVSDSKFAGECLATNDLAFAGRPKMSALEILCYNYALIFASPYGEYFRQIRKILVIEVLSNHRIEKLKHVRESEIKCAIQAIYQEWIDKKNSSDKVFVELKKWFFYLSSNLIFKVVIGKRYGGYFNGDDEGSDRLQNITKEAFAYTGKFVASDALPFLKWFDPGGDLKAMKKIAKDLDCLMENWLQEHKQNKAKGEEAFMGVLLSILNQSELPSQGLDSDTINKATSLALLLAASDTTSIALTWTLSLLLNHPQVLKKAQQEIDSHVGKERQVVESDTKNLVYLHAIIKESFRLHPPAALLPPHESTEDCNVGGYHIPAGTRLIVNISKIQRDSKVWLNPSEFNPERFLTTHKDVDVRRHNFEFIPFGSGRRGCPGISFALPVLHLALATLLHSFEIETLSDQPVDLTESAGLTNAKATPLEALLTPRLPFHVYHNY